MIKTFQIVGKEATYLNIIKDLYDKKLIPNIIPSGEKLKAFSLKSETRQRHPLTSFLFKIVLEFLSMTIREEKM